MRLDGSPWQPADPVVDLLDVHRRPVRDHVGTVAADLLEALGADLLRQHDARAIAQARSDQVPPMLKFPVDGNDQRVPPGEQGAVELLLDQDRVGGPDLVRAGRKEGPESTTTGGARR